MIHLSLAVYSCAHIYAVSYVYLHSLILSPPNCIFSDAVCIYLHPLYLLVITCHHLFTYTIRHLHLYIPVYTCIYLYIPLYTCIYLKSPTSPPWYRLTINTSDYREQVYRTPDNMGRPGVSVPLFPVMYGEVEPRIVEHRSYTYLTKEPIAYELNEQQQKRYNHYR